MKEETYIDSDGQELTKKTWSDGNVRYYNKDGKRHREGGAASIWSDGTEAWFKNGQRHRDDGPALIYSDGTEKWYKDGKFHRLDGPAVIRSDGTEEYWLDGEEVTKKEIDLLWLRKQVEE